MPGRTRDHSGYVPRFEVTVGDRMLSEPGEEIADLVVETTLSGADRFNFTLAHRFDGRRGAFADLSWDRFSVGTDVGIDAGYAADGSPTTLFAGRVGSVTTEFTPERGASVSVSGYGLLRETMRGTRSDSWSETTVGAVVEDVLSGYEFTTVAVDADRKRERLVQHAQNDYRFLDDLAGTYGASFHARRETVRFVPPDSVEDGNSPVATLTYGDELESFRARASPTPSGARVRSWNPEEAKPAVVSATDDPTTGGGVGSAGGSRGSGHEEAFTVPNMSTAEAKRIAATRADQLNDAAVAGHGRADGDPSIQAGATVALDGLGERFSGPYCVTSATHRLGGDGYRTAFEAREVAA